jgi:DNA-binding NarL/FixJ family response regulator
MIRVLICDDQRVVCDGLRAILSTVPGIQVVGTAHDGAEAVDQVAATHPDVVLMDLKMPIASGVQATREIRSRFPGTHVLVLTTYDADEWVFDAIRAGAAGYLLKESQREALVAAIEGTAAGKSHVDPAVAGRVLAHVAHGTRPPASSELQSLTDRERDVLRCLGLGLSNADVALRLHLSEGTVRNHVSAILSKLGLADRTQAALFALRAGLADGSGETG